MPNSIHAFSEEELMAYLDGELAPERALVAARHLEQCRECQRVIEDFTQVTQRLANWQVESTQSESPKFPEVPKTSPKRGFWRLPWLRLMATAAVLVLIVSIAARRPERRYQQVEQRAQLQAPPARQERMALRRTIPFVAGEPGGVMGGVAGQSPAPPPPPALSPISSTQPGPLIVRTAQLSLTSKHFGQNQADIQAIAKDFQGYVSQIELTTPASAGRSLSATLRVPAAQLDSVLLRLRNLGQVESESQHGDDVTQRFVDVNARLSNLRTTETRLLQLLREHAGQLAEVLQVEEAVDRTRGEIEVTTAEQKVLSNQIALASIQLGISEEYKVSLSWNRSSILNRMQSAAVQGYENLFDLLFGAIESLISYGPVVLLAFLILFFPARWAWKQWLTSSAAGRIQKTDQR